MVHRGRKSIYDSIQPAMLRPQLIPDPPASTRRPPAHLGEPEREVWKRIVGDHQLTDVALDVLTVGLEAHERARECRLAIQHDGMVVTGRDGQVKAHPLLAVERDARAAFLAAIKQLGLEL
jgi:P27 family predicted phage terminase small subunit